MEVYKREGRKYVRLTRAEVFLEGLKIIRDIPKLKETADTIMMSLILGEVSVPEALEHRVQDSTGVPGT